jgi:hypothetical protein
MNKKLLPNHPPHMTAFGQFPRKPSSQFARSISCMGVIRIIHTDVYTQYSHLSDSIKSQCFGAGFYHFFMGI